MELDAKKVFKTLNLNKIWVPVVIGLGVVLYLVVSDPNFTTDRLKLIGQADWHYVLLAVLAIVVRDLGYIYRIRILTHNKLSWLASFYIIVLWEFSSAVTPSVVGGGIVAIFLLIKEGIKPGKAIAYVTLTTIFDNAFFMLAASPGLVGVYEPIFTDLITSETSLGHGLRVIFWVSYVLVIIYTLATSFALFINPRSFKWILLKFTSMRLLRRWRQAAYRHGNELALASQELQDEKLAYWLKIGLTTLGVWMARYVILNLLIAAYVSLDFVEHLDVLGKQIVLWTTMLVSPAPGSSGTAEFIFKHLHGNALGDYTLIMGIMWRLFTYYPYLFLGAIFLPRWLRRVFAKHKAIH